MQACFTSTDIEPNMTPYAAGLGAFVDLSKPDFNGRSALEAADKSCLLFGLECETKIPHDRLPKIKRNHIFPTVWQAKYEISSTENRSHPRSLRLRPGVTYRDNPHSLDHGNAGVPSAHCGTFNSHGRI
jgi:hypothetical protein